MKSVIVGWLRTGTCIIALGVLLKEQIHSLPRLDLCLLGGAIGLFWTTF